MKKPNNTSIISLKHIYGIIILIAYFPFVFSTVLAQEGTSASGGQASGSGGTASYSVGQLVYTSFTGANGTVTQGVQQAYKITAITGIEDGKFINLLAFPNPTTSFLTLIVENDAFEHLTYQLYDMNGKLLDAKKLTSNETSISMIHLPSTVYMLKVIDHQKEAYHKKTGNSGTGPFVVVKTFKIIKH